MDRWVGKVAVVTGASAGIGAAILTTLASKGLIAVGLARRDDAIKTLANKCKGNIYAIKCDVTKEEDVVRAFQWIEKNLGGISLLVNNSGVLHSAPLTDETADNWKEMLNVNILGLSICTREAAKSMKKHGDEGHIVHINSIAGHSVLPYGSFGMYTATKHAVTALTEALRIELYSENSKIKITSLSPGLVDTDMGRRGIDVVSKGAFKDDGEMEGFLTSQDLADTLIAIISMKPYIQIQELTLQAIGRKLL